jgi:hypothetical protein
MKVKNGYFVKPTTEKMEAMTTTGLIIITVKNACD